MTSSPGGGRLSGTAGTSPTPSVRRQSSIWLRIGLASFGGGQGTRLNIYRAFVEDGQYMSPLEFAEAWAVCQIGPGMSLVALAALIGFRFSKVRGALAALAGLLAPSAVITVGMTAAYLRLKDVPATASAIHGVVAAVLGIAFANAVFNARPLLAASSAMSRPTLGIAIALIVVDALTFAVVQPPVIALLLPSAGIFAIWTTLHRRRVA